MKSICPSHGFHAAQFALATALTLSGCTDSSAADSAGLGGSETSETGSTSGDGDGDPAGDGDGDGDGDVSGDGDGDVSGDGDGDMGDGDGDPGDGDGDPGDGDGDPGDGDGDPGDGDGDPGDGDGDPGDGDGDLGDGDGDGDMGDGDGDEEPAVCGDGILGPSEPCDDGNDIPGDGCENDCTHTVGVAWSGGDEEGCTTIGNMEWLGSGDIVSAGNRLIASWDPDTGEMLATQRIPGNYADISITADGVIAVGRDDFDGGIGAVWRYDSDLELIWSTDATTLAQDPEPWTYLSVVALPDEGSVVLDVERNILRLGADGELLASVEFPYGNGLLQARMRDMALVGDEVWVLYDFDNSVQVYARIVRYDPETLEVVGETFWEVSQGPTYHFRTADEIVHLDGRTVVIGDGQDLDDPQNNFGFVTYWEFDMEGNLINTQTMGGLNGTINWQSGMGLAPDGTLVAGDKVGSHAIGGQGQLLWQRDAEAYSDGFPGNLTAIDALVLGDGTAFIGGYHAVDINCLLAGMVRLDW